MPYLACLLGITVVKPAGELACLDLWVLALGEPVQSQPCLPAPRQGGILHLTREGT